MKKFFRTGFFVSIGYWLSICLTSCGSTDTSIAGIVKDSLWVPPSLYTDRSVLGEERQKIIYGNDLIANTSYYLGPRGTVLQMSNGMNCQNCHLDAGRRPWANNFAATFATYPKFRGRSGSVENIYRRINDCFQRSLNGETLDSNSREMQAMYAYLKWVGQDVRKNENWIGAGSEKIPYLKRAADPEKGKVVYENICQTCHGTDGSGLMAPNGNTYTYPPLWGEHSYNDGAGLYRIGAFANYIKSNMPFNQASHESPVLSLEQAWDVAAFVNSQPRPHKDQSGDYKDLTKKPVDFPFGPYADSFPEIRHKYGPFGEMNMKEK